MKKYDHIKQKAQKLREQGKSINDICKQLNKSKGTVWYWIKNTTIKKQNVFLRNAKSRNLRAARAAGRATKKKYKLLHANARVQAISQWQELKSNKSFRMFIMLYWCEGYKKTKHVASIANSDVDLMKLAKYWMNKFSSNNLIGRVQIHEDQDEAKLKDYWYNHLSVEIRTMRKTNSGKMKGRNWNSQFGVCSILVSDAYFKTKIDTWIDLLRKEITKHGV